MTVPGSDLDQKIQWLYNAGVAPETINLIVNMAYADGSERILPRKNNGQVDRSSVYWRVCVSLQYDEHFPLERILGIFLDRDFKISESFFKPASMEKNRKWIPAPEGYEAPVAQADRVARRQIAKARAKFVSGFFDRNRTLEENLAKEKEGVETSALAPNKSKSGISKQTPGVDENKIIIHASKPAITARVFVKKHYPTLLYHNFDWLTHSGAIYKKLEDGRIETDLSTFLASAYMHVKGPDGKQVLQVRPDTEAHLRHHQHDEEGPRGLPGYRCYRGSLLA